MPPITMVFSFYFMMEILIQRIGLMQMAHTLPTGTMLKNQLDFTLTINRYIDSLKPLQQMLALAQPG